MLGGERTSRLYLLGAYRMTVAKWVSKGLMRTDTCIAAPAVDTGDETATTASGGITDEDSDGPTEFPADSEHESEVQRLHELRCYRRWDCVGYSWYFPQCGQHMLSGQRLANDIALPAFGFKSFQW